MTLTLILFLSLISCTKPSKSLKGPSITFTESPTLNGISISCTVVSLPSIDPTSDTICLYDAPLTLRASNSQSQIPDSDLSIVWYGPNGLIGGANGMQIGVSQSGTYEVVMTNTNGNCESVRVDGVTTSDIIVQDIQVSIDNSDMDVEVGEEVVLSATVSGELNESNVSYDWYGNAQGNVGVGNPIDYLAAQRDTIYVIVVESTTGCTDTSSTILVNALEPIDIPTAFSPNGDGINDVWHVPGLETYRTATVRIYNRWGQVVFSKTGEYYQDFDGTRNGKDLPVGTYYYVIQLNQDGKEDLSGDVTITR